MRTQFSLPVFCAAALLLCACAAVPEAPVAAVEPAPQAVTQTEPTLVASAEDDNKVVCRKIDSTGSRVRREKVCMTSGQWKEQEEEAKKFGNSMQGNGSTQPGGESLGN